MPNAETSEDQAERAFSAKRFLTTLVTSMDSALPLSYVMVFILVAENEGLGPSEYARMYGTSQPMMSRYLIELSVRGRNHIRKSGLGLIERRENPEDLRAQLYFLTLKGKQVYSELLRFSANKEGRGS